MTSKADLSEAERAELAKLTAQLLRGDVSPFVDYLARVVLHRPSDERLRKFADDHPDKHGQLATRMAAVIGYAQNIAVHHTHAFESMSTAELDRHIAQSWLDRGLVASLEEGMKVLRAERQPTKLLEADPEPAAE